MSIAQEQLGFALRIEPPHFPERQLGPHESGYEHNLAVYDAPNGLARFWVVYKPSSQPWLGDFSVTGERWITFIRNSHPAQFMGDRGYGRTTRLHKAHEWARMLASGEVIGPMPHNT